MDWAATVAQSCYWHGRGPTRFQASSQGCRTADPTQRCGIANRTLDSSWELPSWECVWAAVACRGCPETSKLWWAPVLAPEKVRYVPVPLRELMPRITRPRISPLPSREDRHFEQKSNKTKWILRLLFASCFLLVRRVWRFTAEIPMF